MIIVGICMDVAWIGTLVYGIVSGIWWPFPIALAFVIAAGLWQVFHYGAHATYLCPACKAEFRPRMGAFIISGHTPRTRKLTCPAAASRTGASSATTQSRLKSHRELAYPAPAPAKAVICDEAHPQDRPTALCRAWERRAPPCLRPHVPAARACARCRLRNRSGFRPIRRLYGTG